MCAQKTNVKALAAVADASTAAALAAAAPVKAALPKTVDTFKFLKNVAEGEKLAPQAKVIVNVIEAAGTAGLTRENLSKGLEGKLVTRQPIGRIVTYYQKTLVERGYIRIDSVEIAAAA